MANVQTYQINVKANTKNAAKNVNTLKTAMKGLVAYFGAREVIKFGKEIVQATSTLETYNNKIRIITNSSKQFADTQVMLVRLAGETRSSYGDVLDLYSKLKVSTESLGISSERVAVVTSNLSKALVVAGADGNTAASVIRQFGQAMASGEVRGDEFRSLVEGLGPALSVMARETGITVGELRAMSKAGELTADVMFEMIENSTALTAAFGMMDETIANIETAFNDSKVSFMGYIGDITGLSEAYKEVLKDTMRFMDRISEREGSLALVKDEDLVNIQGANGALKELESRYGMVMELYNQIQAGDFGTALFGLINVDAEAQIYARKGKIFGMGKEQMARVDALFELIDALKLVAAQEDKDAEKTKADNIIREKTNQLIAQITKGSKEQMKLLAVNAKIDLSTPYEKAQAATIAHGDAVSTLHHQLVTLGRLEKDDLGIVEALIKEKSKAYMEAQAVHDTLIKAEFNAWSVEQDRLKTAQQAIVVKGRQIDDITREVNELGVLSELQEDIAEANKKALALTREIQDEIEILTDKELLLHQVELNRLAEVEKAKDDALERGKERAKEKEKEDKEQAANELKLFFDVNKKNFEVLGKYSRLAFNLNKALAIAEAIMGAKQAALNAFAFTMKVFPPLAYPAMAASYAATAATVAAIASQPYPGRAGGGSVQAGRAYMVGEGGRSEMFVPGQNGSIVPNSELNGSAINVNFQIDNVDATSFDELLLTRKNLIVSMVRQAVGQGRLG